MTNTLKASDFSPGLFWDIDPADLDETKHRKYLIGRILEAGTIDDWRLACRHFTLQGIIETARQLRSLDKKSLAFLSVIGHIPEEDFRCYTSEPSIAKHWIC